MWRNPKSRIFSRLALPKGLRTLVFSFDDAHLTHFSGRGLLPGFCQQLRLRRLLQREGLPPQATGDFQPAGLLRALICVRVAGLKRVSKTQILQSKGVFLCLLGLERFPDPSSLRRCLQRRSPHPIRERLDDLPLSQIPSAQWLATVAFFQTLLLACNLGPGFKRLCRPKSYGAATVETVRRDFLAVPGRWVNRAPRQGLHLPRDYPWRAEWLGAVRAIRKLRLRQKNLNLSVNLAHASNVDGLFYAPGTLHMHF